MIEPALRHIPAETMLRRLHSAFGERPLPACREQPASYRRRVAAELELEFGAPLPNGLLGLVDAAARLGADPTDFVQFIGRELRLTSIRVTA